jgi:hypothetical protein
VSSCPGWVHLTRIVQVVTSAKVSDAVPLRYWPLPPGAEGAARCGGDNLPGYSCQEWNRDLFAPVMMMSCQ